jgi:glycosyltransferase involved in cell wall biosynthesis
VKVCFINTNIAWGGGEKWHFNQALILKRAGFNISFIVNPNSELHKKIKSLDYKIITLKVRKTSFLNPFMSQKIKKIFLQEQFNAIIINLPQDVKTFAQTAYLTKTEKVIYRRGMDHPIKNSLMNRKIYPYYITHFIANSERVKLSIAQNFPILKDKTIVIYNGVSLHEIPPLKATSQKLIIGNLARLVEQKGHKYMIPLAQKLKELKLDFEIRIAGTGPLKMYLQNLIESHNLSDKIKLVGQREPYQFLKTIDFFVFPSLFEGLSNSLLEAQLFRKPTFAFNTSSNEEVITDSKNGYIAPNFDTELMAKQIYFLWNNKEKQNQIQEACLETLKHKFDQEQLNKKLIELLNE